MGPSRKISGHLVGANPGDYLTGIVRGEAKAQAALQKFKAQSVWELTRCILDTKMATQWISGPVKCCINLSSPTSATPLEAEHCEKLATYLLPRYNVAACLAQVNKCELQRLSACIVCSSFVRRFIFHLLLVVFLIRSALICAGSVCFDLLGRIDQVSSRRVGGNSREAATVTLMDGSTCDNKKLAAVDISLFQGVEGEKLIDVAESFQGKTVIIICVRSKVHAGGALS